MSLNNIQLNSSLVADLYKNSLVELEETHSAEQKVLNPSLEKNEINELPTAEWKYLGNNQKNILLLVRDAGSTYLPDSQLNFLTSVLTACKLGLADVAIMNITHTPSSTYAGIQEKFKSSVIILLGITPTEFAMPMNFPEFQVQAFNQCTFLYTPGIDLLEADKVLKSKFWVCLRRIFEV